MTIRYSNGKAPITAPPTGDVYTVGKSRLGHYRQPGSHLTYCGRNAAPITGAPKRMCQHCEKGEALDRAEAERVAAQWREAVPEQAAAPTTESTWHAEWIGEHTTTTTPALFDLDTEQGALFA